MYTNVTNSVAISMTMPLVLYNTINSPDGVQQWLHQKPLNAAIGRVPVSYCPGGTMVIIIGVGKNATHN
jgi:hypothetical protein